MWPGAGGRTSEWGPDPASQSRLQLAIEAGAAAAFYTDLRTRERWWSPGMFAIHGLAGTEDAPADYLSLVHPADRGLVAEAFQQSMTTGRHRVEYRVVWPDGSCHWLEGTGRADRAADSSLRAISGLATLIDARRKQEADLRFLAQASSALARSSDEDQTLRSLAAMAVEHFADWCAIDIYDERADELRRVAVAHVDPEKVKLAEEIQRRYPPDREATTGLWNVMRTAKAEIFAELSPELLRAGARDEEHLRIIQSLGLRSYMGVPIRGAGDSVLGVVTFVSSDSGRIYEHRDLELATDLVGRAAVAIQNARLIRQLQDSKVSQGLLLELTDVLRATGSTEQVLQRVSALLGRHFKVDRVGYGHVDERLDLIEYDVCWTSGTTPPLLGAFPASAFGQQVIDRLRNGETIVIANVRTHPYTADEAAQRTSQEVDTRAILVVPLFKAGRLRTIVYLNQGPERQWQPGEISLMEQVAERTRELIERGRAEDSLRASEAKWRGLFERMVEGFFIAQAIRDASGRMVDFRFLELNPAFETLTGLKLDDAIGKPVTQAIPGIPLELIDTYARVLDTGTPAEFEVHVPALNDRWYEARARSIGDDQFSVLFLEVTERKIADRAIKEGEARYRALFEAIDEGFCIVQVILDEGGQPADYRFMEVNPAFERQTGLSGAAGRTIRELIPEIESSYIQTYGGVALTGQSIRYESQSQSLGRWFDAFAFRVGAPKQLRVALLLTDITERKAAEQALRDADSRKDEFLATLAHELRNPLAPISTGLAILKRVDVGNPKAERARDLMERQLQHMVRLMDDLLDVSRVSRGKISLRKSAVSLRSLVDTALDTSMPLIEAAGHSISVQLPDDPVMLKVDPTRIAQVLSNVVNNAARYTPAGGAIRLEAATLPGGRVSIKLTDNGIGIPPDMLESVFELFMQVRGEGAAPTSGLGIGLALARSLVDLHGGSIRAQSAGVGQGSTFTVELPTTEATSSNMRTSSVSDKTRKTRSILVVDDNADAAESLSVLLQMDGQDVRVANTGREALVVAQEQRPDLMFLDIGLPDISGYELAQQMRRVAGLEDATLVALTGWGAARDQQRAKDAGFNLHLTKPVGLDDLRKALAINKNTGPVAP